MPSPNCNWATVNGGSGAPSGVPFDSSAAMKMPVGLCVPMPGVASTYMQLACTTSTAASAVTAKSYTDALCATTGTDLVTNSTQVIDSIDGGNCNVTTACAIPGDFFAVRTATSLDTSCTNATFADNAWEVVETANCINAPNSVSGGTDKILQSCVADQLVRTVYTNATVCTGTSDSTASTDTASTACVDNTKYGVAAPGKQKYQVFGCPATDAPSTAAPSAAPGNGTQAPVNSTSAPTGGAGGLRGLFTVALMAAMSMTLFAM